MAWMSVFKRCAINPGRTRADIDTLRRLHGRNRGIKMRRESHHVMILLTP
ncbi:hypothetical protein SAMN05660380_00827, partial [Xylella fastidiosa]